MSHYEDEAQVEQLRQWWRENWVALAGGLGLGLAGIFGWEKWQDLRTEKAEQASQIYEDLKRTPAEKVEAAAEMGQRLVADFAGTPYAAQAALLLARRAGDREDWDTARTQLEWVVRHADDPGSKKVAKLRLARVLWHQGQADAALAQLEIADGDAFASLYQELRGDILVTQGDRAAARQAYQKALQLGPSPMHRDPLQRKLDDLGAGTAQATS